MAEGSAADRAPKPEMNWIPGGLFRMGSDTHYAEEGPACRVRVSGFWMDRAPVTNRDFARFADETGYVTGAERVPDPKDYPGADPAALRAGSLVFRAPRTKGRMRHWGDWWQFVAGASWRRPDGKRDFGPERLDHPVVHIASEDAEAYAAWAGKSLPSEAEWEFAARGGLEATEYAWGDAFMPGGVRMANTWPGPFPMRGDAGSHRYGTSSVGAFPPNGYGLADMIGNVWEWTADFWTERHAADAAKPCCIPRDPRMIDAARSFDRAMQEVRIPRKVLKGGSHLCAPNYCRRYRPAARHPQMIDSGTSHVGFRCILRPAGQPPA